MSQYYGNTTLNNSFVECNIPWITESHNQRLAGEAVCSCSAWTMTKNPWQWSLCTLINRSLTAVRLLWWFTLQRTAAHCNKKPSGSRLCDSYTKTSLPTHMCVVLILAPRTRSLVKTCCKDLWAQQTHTLFKPGTHRHSIPTALRAWGGVRQSVSWPLAGWLCAGVGLWLWPAGCCNEMACPDRASS